MQTLDAPVYEVKQDSEWYKNRVKRDLQIKEFFKKINAEYFKDNGFSFYHSEWFGVQGDSADYETYKDEVMKNPNKDGVHIIKKRSKYFAIFKELLEQIDDSSPFKSHDVLGFNNISGSQWVGNRWFFGVKHEEFVKGEEVTLIDYKEYLKVVMDSLT
jgi:hypothetical protein